MFAIIRDCADRFIQKCRTKRKLTFAILGLDDAGKTTTAKGLSGEIDHADTTATIGFDKDEIKLGKYEITIFDLGGGRKIRDIWKNYLAEVHGIIFVVDSSRSNRMRETRQVLGNLLKHPSMTGKPILLLANKQDEIGALDELDLCEVLNLEALVNKNRCPCRVESCSASSGTGKKMDPNIVGGIMWLCNLIDQNFDKFTDRIDNEMKELRIHKQKEAVERKERVRRIREEREKQRLASGEAAEEAENPKEDEHLINGDGDPFKRLNPDYFSKPKEPGLEATPNLPAVESMPSSSSSHFYSSPVKETAQLLPDNKNQNNSTGFLSKSKISVVSPHQQDNLLLQNECDPKESGQRPNRPLPILLGNNSPNRQPLLPPANEDPSQVKKNPFMRKTFLQPLDTIDGVAQTNKVKKKKKKTKKNNVAPMTNEMDPMINSSESTLKSTTHLSFVTQPISSHNMATPKNSVQAAGNDMTDSYPFTRKWNLVEELPYMEKLTVEDDDDDDIIT